MDDNNRSGPQNQPSLDENGVQPSDIPQPINDNDPQVPPIGQNSYLQPAYETIEIGREPMQPEEVPDNVVNPSDANMPQEPLGGNGDMPPPVYQENRGKYLFIVGGVLFFIVAFFLLLKFLMQPRNSAPVTLTYWGLWEDREVMDPLIREYQKKNSHVTINYQKMDPADDYRQKLLVRGKTGKGPDMYRFHNTWLPEMQEIVAPLPPSIMTNEEFEKTFYPIHSKDLKIGKYYYGIPLEIDGLVLIYNDDILKKGGYAKPPSNLDELADPAFLSKFTFTGPDGKLQSSAIALGTASNVEHFPDIFGLMLIANGTDIKKLNSSEAAGALNSYRKFNESGIWDESMGNSIAAFTQGKVAMIIAPSWQILNIKKANPDLKLKVAPIPFNLPGSKPQTLANYWVEGVSKYSKNQAEAWKFLKFLSTKESETKLFELESKTRLFGEPYSRVDLADKLAQNQYLSVLAQQADSFVSQPTISRTYDNGLNDEINTYIENAINATMQGVQYSEALGTAKQGVDQVLKKFNVN